ncbi:hypothetical protein [Floridanema aerugineum]|uniref:Uncharacterized protein n=1 Tax=Floridaenema aerugineum BLCC-F46 TaxID=3153654 RepID=A0ABV4X235_9CYAN
MLSRNTTAAISKALLDRYPESIQEAAAALKKELRLLPDGLGYDTSDRDKLIKVFEAIEVAYDHFLDMAEKSFPQKNVDKANYLVNSWETVRILEFWNYLIDKGYEKASYTAIGNIEEAIAFYDEIGLSINWVDLVWTDKGYYSLSEYSATNLDISILEKLETIGQYYYLSQVQPMKQLVKPVVV